MITQAWTLLALERLACRLAVSEKKLLEAYRQITELCRGRVSVVELEYVLEAPICYLPGAELSTRPIRPSREAPYRTALFLEKTYRNDTWYVTVRLRLSRPEVDIKPAELLRLVAGLLHSVAEAETWTTIASKYRRFALRVRV